VFTEYTLFVAGSKAIAMFRLGDTAIKPGEVPALSGETAVSVSLKPSTITSLPNVLVALTP
jgi:hypothetical protein